MDGPAPPTNQSSILLDNLQKRAREIEKEKALSALEELKETSDSKSSLEKELRVVGNKLGMWSASEIQAYVKQIDPEFVESLVIPQCPLSKEEYFEKLKEKVVTTLVKRNITHHTNPEAAQNLYLSRKAAHDAKEMRTEGKPEKLVSQKEEEAKEKRDQAYQQINLRQEKVVRTLGAGAFSTAQAVTDGEKGGPIAVKKSLKRKDAKEEVESLQQEIKIIKEIEHPNIIKVVPVNDEAPEGSEMHKHVYLEEGGVPLMSLLKGGEKPDSTILEIAEHQEFSTGPTNAQLEEDLESRDILQGFINGVIDGNIDMEDADIYIGKLQRLYQDAYLSRETINDAIKVANAGKEKAQDQSAAEFLGVITELFKTWEPKTFPKIVTGGPLPIENIKHVSRQVAEALNYLHKKKIIYLDLRPDNVLLQPDWTVKIIDFGLSKYQKDYKPEPTWPTPFSAPEKLDINNEGYSYEHSDRIDVYSLGALLCLLATGDLYNHEGVNIFDIDEALEASDSLQSRMEDNLAKRYPHKHDQQAIGQFANLLKHMLHANPEERYSMEQVLQHEFFNGFDWSRD